MLKDISAKANTCVNRLRESFGSIWGNGRPERRAKLIAAVIYVSLFLVVASVVNLIYDCCSSDTLKIATGAPGSEYDTFGQAMKKVLEAHQSRVSIKLVTETDGSYDNVTKLQEGEVDLALAQNDTPAKESIRSIALLFPEVVHLYVRGDNDVERLGELKNVEIATLPPFSGTYQFFGKLLKHHDLGTDDVNVVPLRPGVAHKAFHHKEVDGVFHVIALGSTAKRYIGPSLRDGARLLGLEQVEALKYNHPFLKPCIIPKGFYNGYPPLPERDIPSAAVHSVLLVHKDVSEGLVYEITRILHEHRNELVEENKLAAMMKITDSSEEILFPLHSGAQEYLNRDKPMFLVKYADTLTLLLSAVMLFGSWTWHLRLQLERRQKNRADMYNIEIVSIIEDIQDIENAEELQKIKMKLLDIFKRVIQDFDRGNVSAESFQYFAFPWETAISVARHRELMLMNPK